MNILTDPNTSMMLPMLAIGAIFYFLLWRPQSQRQKQLRQMIDNLRRGDMVVTSGGILGKVVKAVGADETEILIEIADNVQVKVVKATLTDVRVKSPEKNEGKV